MRTALTLALTLTMLAAVATAGPRTPTVGPPVTFATSVPGPEGISFERRRSFVVGTATGDILRFLSDGSRTTVGSVGEPLAGVTVLRDGRILAASFGPGRVWAIDPDTGGTVVFASSVSGANFILETKRRQILVSASNAGTVLDITNGTPVVRASGLSYPNGLALGPKHSVYIAQTTAASVVRSILYKDGTLGPPEPYATGIAAADGILFDRAGNLLAVGADTLYVVPRGGGAATVLSSDAALNWPSNLAFGTGRGFGRDLYLVNFGLPLGSGTTIIKMPYSR